MIWNQFSMLQPVGQFAFPQLKRTRTQIFKPVNIFSIEDYENLQKPFTKLKIQKNIDCSTNDEQFENLLRKIEKVKQDYEQFHSYSSNSSYTMQEESLSFKRKTRSKPESPEVINSPKRIKTSKGIESSFGVDRINQNDEKTPSNFFSKINVQKPPKFNSYSLELQPYFHKTNPAKPACYDTHKQLNFRNFENKENLVNYTFNPSPNKIHRPQHKKKIKIDLNILNNIPVRQSINIDFNDLTNLQRNLGFLALIQKEKLQFSDFQMGPSIGSGKFGDVYLCKHKKTNFVCALKKILKSTIEEYNMVDQFIRQLKISYMVDHPNVIKTYGHFHDEFHVFIIMQYAGDGSVIDNLQSKKGEQLSSNVLFQTLNAVDHLHRLKIVHRDIKPQNIVVFFKDTYKLCDFGLSAFVQNDMKRTFCGTPDYLSPEMKDVGEYDLSVDLWSLGILAFELIVGEVPFKDKISEWKKSGCKKSSYWNWKVEYPKQISQVAKSFMQNLLKQKPEQRAHIISCLRDNFIKSYSKKENNIIKAAELSGF